MSLSEFDTWYRKRFRRTSSALTVTFYVFSDMLGIMLSIGFGFFLVKIYGWGILGMKGIINSKSFITYWPYLAGFLAVFQIFNLYPGIFLAPAERLRRFTISSFVIHGGIILSRYIEKHSWDSITAAFIISFVFSTTILLTIRNITDWILAKTRLGGIPAVVFGSDNTGKLVVDCLLDNVRTGYVPVLILDDEKNGIDEYHGIPIIHDTSLGHEIVNRYKIRMAIIAMQKLDDLKLKHLQNNSISAFRYSAYIPALSSSTNIGMSVRDFGGVLGLVTSNKLKMPWNMAIKRLMDLAIVIIGGIILLPFFLIIAILIKLTSPGPVFFRQIRPGKNGAYFTFYKFRSMVIDAEERLKVLLESDPKIKNDWEKNRKIQNDPRFTAIGQFLRKTSIDEFPQIINILKGEMSLVGPRPVIDDSEVVKYGESFLNAFSIKPGMTGLWQVSGRSNTSYEERIAYDNFYLQSWSIWMDLWILLKTFGVVILGKGAY
ncbi:MAG: exopolysaccharide biosynthesis polyprenyl glycosylphosphotransferase [Treponema sp.]|jgi:Undecaprenyl-phosphate galactose phosphotransferase WbaP|nr:exopolysaccharide biosynthesis polyprenyl glycosylphosphotransferase [Treponema sp.]